MFSGNLSFSQQQVKTVFFLTRNPQLPGEFHQPAGHLVYIVLLKSDSIVIGEFSLRHLGQLTDSFGGISPTKPHSNRNMCSLGEPRCSSHTPSNSKIKHGSIGD